MEQTSGESEGRTAAAEGEWELPTTVKAEIEPGLEGRLKVQAQRCLLQPLQQVSSPSP